MFNTERTVVLSTAQQEARTFTAVVKLRLTGVLAAADSADAFPAGTAVPLLASYTIMGLVPEVVAVAVPEKDTM